MRRRVVSYNAHPEAQRFTAFRRAIALKVSAFEEEDLGVFAGQSETTVGGFGVDVGLPRLGEDADFAEAFAEAYQYLRSRAEAAAGEGGVFVGGGGVVVGPAGVASNDS